MSIQKLRAAAHVGLTPPVILCDQAGAPAAFEAGKIYHVISGTCSDCRHADPDIKGRLTCEKTRTFNKFCFPDDGTTPSGNDPTSKAKACDAEDYCAWLEVAPDFGCIMFEAK